MCAKRKATINRNINFHPFGSKQRVFRFQSLCLGHDYYQNRKQNFRTDVKKPSTIKTI